MGISKIKNIGEEEGPAEEAEMERSRRKTRRVWSSANPSEESVSMEGWSEAADTAEKKRKRIELFMGFGNLEILRDVGYRRFVIILGIEVRHNDFSQG